MIKNQNPHDLICEYVDRKPLFLSHCLSEIADFLKEADDFNCKSELARIAIQEIMKPHQKYIIPHTLTDLYHVEEMLRRNRCDGETVAYLKVQNKRDHVIHALNVYLLGLLLADKLRISDSVPEFSFQWKLASLFHDIGYPIEIAMDLINQSVLDNLNKVVDSSISGDEFTIKFNLSKFKRLSTGEDALELVQKCFRDSWGLSVNALNLYRSNTYSNKINHGVVSSLLLMAYVDHYYKKMNPGNIADDNFSGTDGCLWGRDVFRRFVVPPCAAIMLHDANVTKKKISIEKAPLAWLLRVTDALQDWERPKSGFQNGIPSFNYRIGFYEGFIEFKCPEGSVNAINRDLSSLEKQMKGKEFIRVSELKL